MDSKCPTRTTETPEGATHPTCYSLLKIESSNPPTKNHSYKAHESIPSSSSSVLALSSCCCTLSVFLSALKLFHIYGTRCTAHRASLFLYQPSMSGCRHPTWIIHLLSPEMLHKSDADLTQQENHQHWTHHSHHSITLRPRPQRKTSLRLSKTTAATMRNITQHCTSMQTTHNSWILMMTYEPHSTPSPYLPPLPLHSINHHSS